MVSVNDLQNHKTQVTSLRKYDSPHFTFTFIFCLKQKIYMHVGRHTHTHKIESLPAHVPHSATFLHPRKSGPLCFLPSPPTKS